MICVVSRREATAEYEPFCVASQLCLDVCLDSIIKVLSQMQSHVHVAKRFRTLNKGK